MWKTNAAVDLESGLRKISPALEVVTHRRLNRKFGPAESRTPQKGLNLGVTDQLQIGPQVVQSGAPHFLYVNNSKTAVRKSSHVI